MSKPYVVGIAGGSASGKSTLCDRLEKSLEGYPVQAFHMDEYFRPEAKRPYVKAPFTDAMYVDDNHPETMDLPKLRQDLKAAVEARQSRIILVEGLLTLWDEEVRGLLDLKIFVDCPADERIVRRLRRNMEWGLTFDQVSRVYVDLVRHRHDTYVEPSRWYADLVVNGSNPSPAALSMLTNALRARAASTERS